MKDPKHVQLECSEECAWRIADDCSVKVLAMSTFEMAAIEEVALPEAIKEPGKSHKEGLPKGKYDWNS